MAGEISGKTWNGKTITLDVEPNSSINGESIKIDDTRFTFEAV